MSVPYQEAYKGWKEVIDVINQAMTDGVVPSSYFTPLSDWRLAAEAELTAIENASLAESENDYKSLSSELKALKAELQEAKDEAEKFIQAAGQAQQLADLLTKLVPLIA